MATKEELKQVFISGATPTEKDFHDLIDLAGQPGPEGKQGLKGADGTDGKDGANGSKGEKGAPGKDGFGTEQQYNDIIARLEALEEG